MIFNKEDLLYKMEELARLLDLVKRENVSEELLDLCHNYRHEIIVCRNTINTISNNMTYEQRLLLKQAEDNINRLYSFKDYIEKLTKEYVVESNNKVQKTYY